MSIKIIGANEAIEVKTATVLFAGHPKRGKTSLACSAENPLLMDFDGGSHRALRGNADTVRIETWEDIQGLNEKILEPYSTIVVDTVGRCLDVIAADIMRNEPKLRTKFDQLTLPGYGALKGRWSSWLKSLHSYGKDVVLIAHGKEERRGDDLLFRYDIMGGTRDEIPKDADAIGYLHMRGKDRVVEWTSTDDIIHAGNPAKWTCHVIPDLDVEPDFLAGLFVELKEAMGRISARGIEVKKAVDTWREIIDKAETPEALTEIVGELANGNGDTATIQAKALVMRRSKEIGAAFNRETKAFEAEAGA